MTVVAQFEQAIASSKSPSPDALLDAAEAALQAAGDFHRLFDVRLVRARRQLGLPITQPTSLQNIPKQHEAEFRAAYTTAGREVGRLFLDADKLADAWAYFRTISEPQPVRDAIAAKAAALGNESGPQVDELLNLALYDGAHVIEGLTLLLRTHGTCNTVTALSQLLARMTPDERRQAATLMVRRIYADLVAGVRRDVERRQPLLKPSAGLAELIAGRESLFADGAYHVDVSHLHSIVSFARHLNRTDPELRLAIELCRYGAQLSEPLRYPADVPFDDYYVANGHFLSALAGDDVDANLKYFIDRLNDEPDPQDKKMIAFVVADLGSRVERKSVSLEAAAPFLAGMEDPAGFSFTTCCVEAGRLDLLESAAREQDDVLALVTARLLSEPLVSTTSAETSR